MKNKIYCMFCKKIISKESTTCPSCGKNLHVFKNTKKKRCSYCNIPIPIMARYCPYCGLEDGFSEIKDEPVRKYDYKGSFVSWGGSVFKKTSLVHIFLKGNHISFTTFGKGKLSVDISRDFYMCQKLSNADAKAKGLSTFKKYVVFVFNNDEIILEDGPTSEILMSKIYYNLVDVIYETETTFYNCAHERFLLF